MDSNKEKNSVWDEYQDPRGAPIIWERSRNHEEDDKHQDTKSRGKIENMRENINGASSVDEYISARGDVLMWDLDDVDVEYTGDTSDHLTSRMTTPVTAMLPNGHTRIPIYSATSNLAKQLSPVGILGTKPYPHRPISSPSDALDTYRFRDLFPNPEHKEEVTNRLGKLNAGGAFVVDNNITMHGDVMMLDLDSEGEGHSDHVYTAVEKFSQLTEGSTIQIMTPMSVTKPVKEHTATTGIRHLMSIRNQELTEVPSGSGIDPEKKRKKKKRKSKDGKTTKDAGRNTQDSDEQMSYTVPPLHEVVDTKTSSEKSSEKRPVGFVKMVRYQMSRFRAYIKQKMICH